MREAQKKIIQQIYEAIQSGYRHIILCAPTGIGKSHIGVTFGRHFGSCDIITAQKVLQDQYCKDFGFLNSSKGRGNYPCMASGAKSCESGVCSWYENKTRQFCDYKPAITDYVVTGSGNVISPPDSCGYYDAKYTALLSRYAVYNYMVFFHFAREKLMKNSASIVADEAHEIEGILADFGSVSLSPQEQFDVTSLEPDGIIEPLQQAIRYHKETDDVSSVYKIQRCNMILRELKKRPENCTIQKRGDDIHITPIDVSHLAKTVFDSPHNLFMSGTIHPDVFLPTMGFDSRDCAYIEAKSSPFEKQNRQVKFCNVVPLNHASTPADYGIAYSAVSKIVSHHPEKGLILCTSTKQCDEITRILGKRAVPAYGMYRDQAISKHVSSDDTILVSPSLYNGLDLADEQSRFQIILKTPYLSMADTRTASIAKKSALWYRYQAIARFIQGCGRSIRHDTDYAVTYVIDSTMLELLYTMKRYIPSAYQDIIP